MQPNISDQMKRMLILKQFLADSPVQNEMGQTLNPQTGQFQNPTSVSAANAGDKASALLNALLPQTQQNPAPSGLADFGGSPANDPMQNVQLLQILRMLLGGASPSATIPQQ